MTDNINNAIDGLVSIFTAADEELHSYSFNTNLQFPTLMGLLAVRLNWDEKQVRENDPIVRYFVRTHKEFHITRGAHGGIMRMKDKQQKEAAQAAKNAAKEQIRAAIEARIAQPLVITTPVVITPVSASVIDAPINASTFIDLDEEENTEE